MDHIESYRIPRYFPDSDEEVETKKSIEEKLYKPSGPDGKGWGEFREMDDGDIEKLKEADSTQAKSNNRIDSS